MAYPRLFVGVGSAHGDDQIGWRIAEQLAARPACRFEVRRAAHPAEMLDWLAGLERLDACDACVSGAAAGTLSRWTWPADELRHAQFQGSHDLPLPAVLELAAQLGMLPPRVIVWGVAIARAKPGEELSAALAAAIPPIVDAIWRSFEQE